MRKERNVKKGEERKKGRKRGEKKKGKLILVFGIVLLFHSNLCH